MEKLREKMIGRLAWMRRSKKKVILEHAMKMLESIVSNEFLALADEAKLEAIQKSLIKLDAKLAEVR